MRNMLVVLVTCLLLLGIALFAIRERHARLRECTNKRVRVFAIALAAYGIDNKSLPAATNLAVEKALGSGVYDRILHENGGRQDWRSKDCFERPLVFQRLSATEMAVRSMGQNGIDEFGRNDDIEARAICTGCKEIGRE